MTHKDAAGQAIPKSIPSKLAERVWYWDDERPIGNAIIITLRNGWKDGSDPLEVCHTIGADTVSEALTMLRDTHPCDCDQCRPK